MIRKGVFEKERSFFIYKYFYMEAIDKVDKKEYSSI